MVRALVLCAVLVSSLPAVVVSAPDSGGDWWREGQTTPWSFGQLDADGDGKVSAGEVAAARQQLALAIKETKASLMAAVDLDHSGRMSRYEAAEATPRWVSLRERARELAVATSDRDGDGKLKGDETLAIEQRIGQVFVRYGASRVDTNHDKNFSRAEVQAAIIAIRDGKGALFTLCDLSNDGQLSVREVEFAFALLAAAAGL
jgi:hypothetical protein